MNETKSKPPELVVGHYLGVDWSESHHALCLTNRQGEKIVEQSIEHSVKGFEQLLALCQKAQVEPSQCVVGIETAHSLLIDWLWSQGFQHLYVVPPATVDKSRSRFHLSGAKDDRLDAAEITQLLRLERQRLLPWQPGSARLQQLRATVRFALFLSRRAVAEANRLRAVLLRYYPAALATFSTWPTRLSCQLVIQYPTPADAQAVRFADFKAFALAQHYPKPKELLACFDRLQAAYPQPALATSAAYAPQAVTLAQLLHTTLVAKENTLQRAKTLFAAHEDASIFASLPGVGDLLAPALLVKFGEDRNRFPAPALLQTLAGTCPVTVQSNKSKHILFRHACDHEFRYISQQWALHSLNDSAWATAYFHDVLQRHPHRQHAYRTLANRWLAIAWRCWQDRQPYDEACHLQRRAQRRLPKVSA